MRGLLLRLGMLSICACGSTSPGGGGDSDARPVDAPGTTAPVNGNPDGHCVAGVPAAGMSASVSAPDTVVGTGTAASCTFAALSAAVTKGGIITFNCGSAPITIAVTATMDLPIDKDTVIDGGRKVTLDGGGNVQILRFDSPNFQTIEIRVTLQHIRLSNGKIAGSSPIPTAPAPCSQGFNAGEGGAIFMRDGNLSVIDCIFEDNKAAPLGPDVGGGAIRDARQQARRRHRPAARFRRQLGQQRRRGRLPVLRARRLRQPLRKQRRDRSRRQQRRRHEVQRHQQRPARDRLRWKRRRALQRRRIDVNRQRVLCGDKIVNNAAGTNAFGGGLFFTSNDFGGTLTITDTTMTGNTGGHWTQVSSGSVTNAGTAVGTNAKSITITSSTLQGVN